MIFYRLYVLGQPDEELRDFQLLLGGVLPIPTWRGALVVYLGLTGTIAAVCLAIYGWPPIEDWASTWLPAFLGPAILVGAYSLVAWVGQRRIDRRIAE